MNKPFHESDEDFNQTPASAKEGLKENGDYVLPADKEKGRKTENSGSFNASALPKDLDDYIYKNPRKHGKRRKKRKSRGQKVLIGVVATLMTLIVCAAAAVFILNIMGQNALLNNDGLVLEVPETAQGDADGRYVTYKGKSYKFNENVTSILCMGVDKTELEETDDAIGTSGNADVLILVSLDTQSGEANMISISRDIMAEIDVYSAAGVYGGTKTEQICLAYAYGNGRESSCDNQVLAVRRLFYNIPIHSYMAFDLSGISVLNDALGGVNVTALETVGPFTKGETVTLLGDNAEKYVRYRDTSKLDSNNMRMERQKQYLQSFFSKAVSQTKADIRTPLTLFNTAAPYTVTNLDAPKVTYFALNMVQNQNGGLEILNVPGEIKQGERYAEYYVDEEQFYEMFLNVYYTPVD